MKLVALTVAISFMFKRIQAAEGFKMRAVLDEDVDRDTDIITLEPASEIMKPQNLTPPLNKVN